MSKSLQNKTTSQGAVFKNQTQSELEVRKQIDCNDLNQKQQKQNIIEDGSQLKNINIQNFIEINSKYVQQTQKFSDEKKNLMNLFEKNKENLQQASFNSQQNSTSTTSPKFESTGNGQNQNSNNNNSNENENSVNDSSLMQQLGATTYNKNEENLNDSNIDQNFPNTKIEPNPYNKTPMNSSNNNNGNLLNFSCSMQQQQQQQQQMKTRITFGEVAAIKQVNGMALSNNNNTRHQINNTNIGSKNNLNSINQINKQQQQNRGIGSASLNFKNEKFTQSSALNKNDQSQLQPASQIMETTGSIQTEPSVNHTGATYKIKQKRDNESLKLETQKNSEGEQNSGSVIYSPRSQNTESVNFAMNASNKGLSDLNQLNFSMNGGNMQYLHSIDLSLNKFQAMPVEICLFKRLKILKMDNNYIKSLHASLFTELRLENFSIMNNLLRSIPEQIIYWKDSLQSLNMAKNHVANLEPKIFELKQLKVLIISSNDFDYLPKEFLKMKHNLKEFAIDWYKYCQPAKNEIAKGEEIEDLFQGFEEIQGSHMPLIHFLQRFSENQQYNFKQTILNSKLRNQMHLSIQHEDISILRFLIDSNPEICDQVDVEGHTPLSLAIRDEKYYCAKLLIFQRANVNLGGGHQGVIKQQFFLVRDLLKMGANPNACDSDGNTALHYLFAIFSKDVNESKNTADLLLSFDTDPNIENKEGWTPLHIAIKKGSIPAVMYILNYNKDPKNRGKNLFQIDKLGGTTKNRESVLHIAAFNGYTELVSILLKECPETFSKDMSINIQINMSQKHNTISKLMKIAQKKFIRHHVLRIPQEEALARQKLLLEQQKQNQNQPYSLKAQEEYWKRALTPFKPCSLSKQQQPSSAHQQDVENGSYDEQSEDDEDDDDFVKEKQNCSNNLQKNKDIQNKRKQSLRGQKNQENQNKQMKSSTARCLEFETESDSLQLSQDQQQLKQKEQPKKMQQNEKQDDDNTDDDEHYNIEFDDQIDHEEENKGFGKETNNFNFQPSQSCKKQPNESQYKLKHGALTQQQQQQQQRVPKPNYNPQKSMYDKKYGVSFAGISSSSYCDLDDNQTSNDSFQDFDVEDFLEENEWPLMHSKGMPYITEKDMGTRNLQCLSAQLNRSSGGETSSHCSGQSANYNNPSIKSAVISTNTSNINSKQYKESMERKVSNLVNNCFQITELRQRILQRNILPKKLSCLYTMFNLHNLILDLLSNVSKTPLYTLERMGINQILSPLELEQDSKLVFLLNNAWLIVQTCKEIYDIISSQQKNKFKSTCFYAELTNFNIRDDIDCQVLQYVIASRYPTQIQCQNEDNILAQYSVFQALQNVGGDKDKYNNTHKFLITDSGFEKFFPMEEEVSQIDFSIRVYNNEKERSNPLIKKQYL